MPSGVNSYQITEQFINEMNAVTNKYFDSVMQKLVYQKSPIFERLISKNKKKIEGGTLIQWPVRIEKLGSAKAVNPRANMEYHEKETRGAAQSTWRYYWASNTMRWDEIALNKGKQQIVNLLKDKAEEISEDMRDLLTSHLYQPAGQIGPQEIDSLDRLIGTGTYAGIDPTTLADATRWRSIVEARTSNKTLAIWTDVTGGARTLAQIYNLANFNTQKPSFVITTEDLYTQIESILWDKRMYTKDEKTTELGYDNFKFKGMTFVVDKLCPAETMYGIDEDALEFVVHPDYDMKATPWKAHEVQPNSLFRGMSLMANFRFKYRHTSFKITGVNKIVGDRTV